MAGDSKEVGLFAKATPPVNKIGGVAPSAKQKARSMVERSYGKV